MSKTITLKNIPIIGKVLSKTQEDYKNEKGEIKTSIAVKLLHDDFVRTVYFDPADAEVIIKDAEIELNAVAFVGVSKNGDPYVILRNQK